MVQESRDIYDNSGFKKHDGGKPRMSLVPMEGLIGVARVMTYGAEKYNAGDWRQPTNWTRLSDAALRHIVSWLVGEDTDESGEHPIDHAVASLMMLSSVIKAEIGTDDRLKP